MGQREGKSNETFYCNYGWIIKQDTYEALTSSAASKGTANVEAAAYRQQPVQPGEKKVRKIKLQQRVAVRTSCIRSLLERRGGSKNRTSLTTK